MKTDVKRFCAYKTHTLCWVVFKCTLWRSCIFTVFNLQSINWQRHSDQLLTDGHNQV